VEYSLIHEFSRLSSSYDPEGVDKFINKSCKKSSGYGIGTLYHYYKLSNNGKLPNQKTESHTSLPQKNVSFKYNSKSSFFCQILYLIVKNTIIL